MSDPVEIMARAIVRAALDHVGRAAQDWDGCGDAMRAEAFACAEAIGPALREAGVKILAREPTAEMSDAAFMNCGDEGSLRLTLEAGWRVMWDEAEGGE